MARGAPAGAREGSKTETSKDSSNRACGRRTAERGANPCLMLTTSRRAWCAMSAGGSACGVVSSFGRTTCCACVSAPRNRTGKDAGAGKTTTASEKPCTALIVVSGAVARSPGEAAPSHRKPLDVNQTDSVRNGVAPSPRSLAFNGCRWHPLSFVRLRERSGRLGRRSPHCRR